VVRLREAGGALVAGVRAARSHAYRSKFTRWDELASVRSSPRRLLADPASDQLFFPPELVPAAAHPLTAELGEEARRALLVHRLYQYLEFTVELEDTAVIPVASKIARGRAGVELPEEMRMDAFKIATDEAWHAQFSYDMVAQVQAATGVPRPAGEPPQFARRLADIGAQLDPDLRGIDDILFAVVSETLISAILSDLPNDRRLPLAVRELVADHAADEGKHHAFFRSLLEFLWPALSVGQRRRIGPWLPELVYAFLEPDYTATALSLAGVGLPSAVIEQVLHEAYPKAAVRRSVADAARSTIRYFRAVGALDEPETLEAFAAAGLLDG
jgi:P-aminobenzoate N-oxygenase AurF